MRIGTSQSFDWNDYLAGFCRAKELGFDCVDLQYFVNTEGPLWQLDDDKFVGELLKIKESAEKAEIEISQVHGPWRYPPRDACEADRCERFEKMAKAIRGAAILGCKYMAIHPLMPFGADQNPDPQEFYRINFEFFKKLSLVAEQQGVIICLENMPMKALTLSTPEQILDLVKDINSPNVKVCFDTGHAAVFGLSLSECIKLIGKEYLAILHVHDNNGREDLHLNPYAGVIDWNDFTKGLYEIDFEGVLSLETDIKTTYMPEHIKEYQLKGLVDIAKHIAKNPN